MMRSLVALLRDNPVSHIACAFDSVIESFRNELYPSYKTSEGIDPDLLGQFSLAEEAVEALGIVTWPMIEYEADDALATACARWRSTPAVEQIVICSPDKDLTQCVKGNRVVCWDRRRAKIIDEEAVEKKYGVRPSSIPDWLALVGDQSDGFPGLRGWGPASATAILSKYGHLEAIPQDCELWKTRLRASRQLCLSLKSGWDDVLLYRELARLKTDVPIKEELTQLRWTGVPEEELGSFCGEIEDFDLFERASALSN
jgi:5'-3' exonuclease